MAKFRVAWIVSEVKEEVVEAESVEDAQRWWENEPNDGGELFFIEDEQGNQVIFD